MYNVEPTQFREFIKKNALDTSKPHITTTPCLVEWRRDEKIMAKVEVICKDELLSVMAGMLSKAIHNKYWIRGNEWKVDKNGDPIKELSI